MTPDTLRPTRTITTEALHRVTAHDFQDALHDLNGDVPRDPDDFTPDTITTLLRDLRACEGYLLTMQRLAEQQAIWQFCSTYTAATRQAAQEALEQRAMRGMANDIGEAGYEWEWERA